MNERPSLSSQPKANKYSCKVHSGGGFMWSQATPHHYYSRPGCSPPPPDTQKDSAIVETASEHDHTNLHIVRVDQRAINITQHKCRAASYFAGRTVAAPRTSYSSSSWMLSTRRHAGRLASSDRPPSRGNRQGTVTSAPAAQAAPAAAEASVVDELPPAAALREGVQMGLAAGLDIHSHLSSLHGERGAGGLL